MKTLGLILLFVLCLIVVSFLLPLIWAAFKILFVVSLVVGGAMFLLMMCAILVGALRGG